MFFLWKYMEYWDGERLNIDINPVSPFFLSFFSASSHVCVSHFLFCIFLCLQFKGMIYRVELMHYSIFHPLNQADLPEELDVYRLGGRKIDWSGSH